MSAVEAVLLLVLGEEALLQRQEGRKEGRMTMRDMGVQWVVGIAVDVAVGIAVSVVIASVMVDHAHAMSTMFRPAWADEVDPAMLSRSESNRSAKQEGAGVGKEWAT